MSSPAWFRSGHSGAEGGDCVAVAAGPVLRVSRNAWAGFVGLASAE
ncbi:DUF397 domain-containing protein [Streptomyces sp. NPDC057682]